MMDKQLEDEVLGKGVKFIERVLHGGEMQESGGNKKPGCVIECTHSALKMMAIAQKWVVMCEWCGVTGPEDSTPMGAIAAWEKMAEGYLILPGLKRV